MNLNDVFDYLKRRAPVQKIPIQWDAKAYTSEGFNQWAAGLMFKKWAGDKETEDEAKVIAKLLKVKQGNVILDVACGYGRHALELVEKYGLKVTGIDISWGLITAAKRLAGEKELDIKYEVRNATDIPWQNEFDGAMIAFNSFSLFSPEDAKTVLQKMHRALKPGGRLFLDLDNKPYNCLYGTHDSHWYRWPSGLTLQEIYFHEDISTEISRDIVFTKDGRIEDDFIIFKRIYTLREIKSLLADNGFRAGRIYGDWGLSYLTERSPKMILVCKK